MLQLDLDQALHLLPLLLPGLVHHVVVEVNLLAADFLLLACFCN